MRNDSRYLNRSIVAAVIAIVWWGISASGQQLHLDKSAGTTASAAAAVRTTDEQIKEVNATFDRYIDGWKRGDVDALGQIYANDGRVTAVWPDPTLAYPVQGWKSVHDELVQITDFAKEEYGAGMDMSYSPRHIELYGDVAIMTTNWKWLNLEGAEKPGAPIIADKSKDIYGKGQATFIFFRQGSKWILIHEHVSVLPTAGVHVENPPEKSSDREP